RPAASTSRAYRRAVARRQSWGRPIRSSMRPLASIPGWRAGRHPTFRPPSRHHRRALSVIPTIVFHGDRDTTVNPINGDQVIAQAKAMAHLRSDVIHGEARPLRYTRTTHSDEGGRPVLEQWVLHHGGHAWSGGSTAGSYTD